MAATARNRRWLGFLATIAAMLCTGLASAAASEPIPLDPSRFEKLSDSVILEQINTRLGAAEKAMGEERFEDCVVAASEAQELAHAYSGFLSDRSQRALALISDCAGHQGSTEQLSQALKQRLVAEHELERNDPHALQNLRALALFHILHGDKAEALQWQALYIDRLANSAGFYDPRYPVALFFLDLAQPQVPAANDRLSIAAAKLDRAREALRLGKAIFGSRHVIYADGLAWLAGRYDEWVEARDFVQDFANPAEEKRLRREADQLLRKAFEVSRRVRGDQTTETLTLASTLAEKAAPDRRAKLLEFVGVNTARKDGPNHPAALMAAFDLALASEQRAAKQGALKAIADRAAALDDPGSAYGFYIFKALVTNFELLSMDKTNPTTEWLGKIDELFSAVQRLSVKAEGRASIPFLRRQLRYRLRHDALRSKADETARQLYQAAEVKRRQEGDLSEAGRRGRDEELAPTYRLVAQSIWKTDGGMANPAADADLAFAALQASLAGSTGTALARAAARNAAGSVSDGLRHLVDRREMLREEIQAMDRRFSDSTTLPGNGATLDGTRFVAARGELEAVNARLQREFPAYFSFIQPAALPIADTMRLLSPDEALIMLVPDGQQTHIFAVNSGGYKWVVATHAKPGLERQVQRLLWDLGAGITVDPQTEMRWANEDGDRFPYHSDIAWQLYRELIEPVAAIVKGRKHLFFVQGGVLSGLPMGVLVTRAPMGDDADPEALRSTSWLVDDFALSILPSVQSLALIRSDGHGKKNAVRHSQRFVGFGDPTLEGRAQARGVDRMRSLSAQSIFRAGTSVAGGTPVDVMRLRSLNRLPGTARELTDISKIFGSRVSQIFLADAATETMVKQTGFDDASVIAFATHGVLAGEIRGTTEPGLVLTPPAEPSVVDDGFLSSSEIAALRMQADWVILSACNTAGSDGLEGAPGLSGLARSFFYAGARSLLVSHWPVRDDVASRLTVDTIRRQRAGLSRNAADAVRASMLAIRDDRSHDGTPQTLAHPNAWAPFSLVGDFSTIFEQD